MDRKNLLLSTIRFFTAGIAFSLFPLSTLSSQGSPGDTSSLAGLPKQKIMILAVFHFASNADMIKNQPYDIMGEQRQKEIAELNESLLSYQPDKIFIEWAPDRQKRVDSLYTEYRNGTFALKANEVYQIGFRLANALDLPTIYCMDAYGHYLYDTLVSTAQKYGQHEKFDSDMKSTFASVMLQDSLSSTLSIRERLQQINTSEQIMHTHLLNAGITSAAWLGEPGEYGAAEFIGEWYKRNIRMFSNIVRLSSSEDERILVIVGAGHARILMHFFEDHPAYELVDAGIYLK